MLWIIPYQSNSFLLNRLRLPFIEIELRVGSIELFKIVEIYDIIGGVFDVICFVFDVHRVRLINLLHKIDQLKRAQFHKLCQSRLNVLIARTEPRLFTHTSILEDAVKYV